MSSHDWVVIERFAAGRTLEEEHCEDLVVDTERFAGVIDSSSGFAAPVGAQTMGRKIALLTLAAFSSASKDNSILDVVADASRSVGELKASLGLSCRHSGGCFFCVLDRQHNVILRLGDCWFSTGACSDRVILPVERPLTEIRVAFLQASLLGGATRESLMRDVPERALVTEYLRVKDNFANALHPRGYGVINGDVVPVEFIERICLPNSVSEISFGTDGYPVSGGSLEQVERELMSVLAQDPLMIHEVAGPKGLVTGGQSYDDRAYLRIARHS